MEGQREAHPSSSPSLLFALFHRLISLQAFEEAADCKSAMERINGFHLQERYLVRE